MTLILSDRSAHIQKQPRAVQVRGCLFIICSEFSLTDHGIQPCLALLLGGQCSFLVCLFLCHVLQILFIRLPDIVFDPFSGSFTTSSVAVKLGRIAIGIDMNEEYYEIGIRRTGIADEYNGRKLVKEKIRKTNAKSKYVRE